MKLDKAYALELKRKFDANGGSTPALVVCVVSVRTPAVCNLPGIRELEH